MARLPSRLPAVFPSVLGLTFCMTLTVAVLATLGTSCEGRKPEKQLAFEKDMATLAEQSKKEGAACDGFIAGLNELLKGVGQDMKLKDKSDTLKLAAKLKEFPAHPESTYRAVQKVYSELPRGESWETTALSNSFTCKVQGFVPVFRVLATNAKAHSLTDAERADAAKVVLEFLRKDLVLTTNLGSLTGSLEILILAIDEGLIRASDPVYVELVRLQKDANQVRTELGHRWKEAFPKDMLDPKKLKAAERKKFNEVLIFELESADVIRAAAFRLLGRMQT